MYRIYLLSNIDTKYLCILTYKSVMKSFLHPRKHLLLLLFITNAVEIHNERDTHDNHSSEDTHTLLSPRTQTSKLRINKTTAVTQIALLLQHFLAVKHTMNELFLTGVVGAFLMFITILVVVCVSIWTHLCCRLLVHDGFNDIQVVLL
jgi:hypothetical protein